MARNQVGLTLSADAVTLGRELGGPRAVAR